MGWGSSRRGGSRGEVNFDGLKWGGSAGGTLSIILEAWEGGGSRREAECMGLGLKEARSSSLMRVLRSALVR